jgi:hypothetical protein
MRCGIGAFDFEPAVVANQTIGRAAKADNSRMFSATVL